MVNKKLAHSSGALVVQCGEIETEVLQCVAKDGRLPAALVEDVKTGKAIKDSYRLACEPLYQYHAVSKRIRYAPAASDGCAWVCARVHVAY